MSDLQGLPREKQLIQLRTCLSLDIQRVLEHTLGIPPDTDLQVEAVLDRLQEHIRDLRNPALRCRQLLCCKQADGETFSDFYGRMMDLADEVDLCSGNPQACADTQLKMILLMGVKDEELIHRLISMDASATLQDMV